ncbi:hypothetical protein EI427_21835 [Flammeovirga pectinis]|uniref:Amidinotransferase n=1 Tax=Flammeovirga pectinis TaxID=2494373 RepID=A0A3Q9FUI2_9BACT|nr:hypothetical protein [Flammeovirga pectinis]AZQ64869.1 hypothetical protein EI427_21835 [Flammeovirga pectinis]
MKIQVNTEWDDLKECIYGKDYGFLFPEWTPEFETILTPELAPYFKKHGGQWREQFDPEGHQRTIDQREAVVKILEDLGVKVHRPERLTEEQLNYYPKSAGEHQGWMRDGIAVIGNNYIELASRRLSVRYDKFVLRPLAKSIKNLGGRWLAMPEPAPLQDPCEETEIPFLEGGDIFPLGKGRVLVANNTGNTASNEAGVDWLKGALGSDYEVCTTRIRPDLIHLDYVLMTPREGVAVIYKDGFIDGIPEWIADWDLIEITEEEAHSAGTNHLVVNSNLSIVAAEHERIAKEIEKRGIEVIRVPYGECFNFGGSLRCSYHPLVREVK